MPKKKARKALKTAVPANTPRYVLLDAIRQVLAEHRPEPKVSDIFWGRTPAPAPESEPADIGHRSHFLGFSGMDHDGKEDCGDQAKVTKTDETLSTMAARLHGITAAICNIEDAMARYAGKFTDGKPPNQKPEAIGQKTVLQQWADCINMAGDIEDRMMMIRKRVAELF